jgi:hypothetical protein
MIRSHEVIPASLEHALVANRVLAALASNDLASPESQGAVEDGLRLLESMIDGERLTASRSVSASSYQSALAYGEGIRAFEVFAYSRRGNEDPVVFLRELVGVASALRGNQRVEENVVQEFRNFFRIMRDIALASSEGPVEKVI